MTTRIFISYRRDDDEYHADKLYKGLVSAFPPDDVFKDVEGHIKDGDRFIEVIDKHIRSCEVMLVVIGELWLDRLINRPKDREDYVLHEIRTALELDKRVIPVLVGGADVPDAKDLPAEIRDMTELSARILKPQQFTADCRQFVAFLKQSLKANGRVLRLRLSAAAGLAATIAVGLAVFWGDLSSYWESHAECFEKATNPVEYAECDIRHLPFS